MYLYQDRVYYHMEFVLKNLVYNENQIYVMGNDLLGKLKKNFIRFIMKINKFTLIYVCVLSFNFIDDDDSTFNYIDQFPTESERINAAKLYIKQLKENLTKEENPDVKIDKFPLRHR